MAEWGIPFDHIENTWTDRQFLTMLRRLTERRRREGEAYERASGRSAEPSRVAHARGPKSKTKTQKYSEWVEGRGL